MAYSGLITSYLGSGVAADRPATPNIDPSAVGVWYSTDTDELDVYTAADGWMTVGGSGGAVTSLNSLTGALTIASAGGSIQVTSGATTVNLEAALATLTDVDITSLADGQVLAWNSGASKWENVTPSSGSVPSGTSFPGSPTTGELFYRTDLGAMFWYSGSAWLNVDSLADLNDVALTTLSSGQILTWNGSAWVNQTPSSGGTVTSVATGTGLTGGPITTSGTIALASIADGDVLANISGSSAAPVAEGVSAVLDHVFGSTEGDILYRGASAWLVLAPGTSGDLLQTGGSGAAPSWVSPPGSTSPVPPFAIVQGLGTLSFNGGTTPTLTFPKTATSGNTLLVFIMNQGSSTISPPTGYSLLFSQLATDTLDTYLFVFYKTAGGTETSVTGSTSTGTYSYPGIGFIEVQGAHSLDQKSSSSISSGSALNVIINSPAITPSAGSMLFVVDAYPCNGSTIGAGRIWAATWFPIFAGSNDASISLYCFSGPGAGASITPPTILETLLYTGANEGVPFATFSIL